MLNKIFQKSFSEAKYDCQALGFDYNSDLADATIAAEPDSFIKELTGSESRNNFWHHKILENNAIGHVVHTDFIFESLQPYVCESKANGE